MWSNPQLQTEMKEKMRGKGSTENQTQTGAFYTTLHVACMFLMHLVQFLMSVYCLFCCNILFWFLFREKPPVKEARPPLPPPSWLQRDLKVRFIDKTFKGGRYYNSKVQTDYHIVPESYFFVLLTKLVCVHTHCLSAIF